MDEAALEPVVRAIAGAHRAMLYGCGREGLMMRALAMRLHHLGLEVCLQGDMTAFPLARATCSCAPRGPARWPRRRHSAAWPARQAPGSSS